MRVGVQAAGFTVAPLLPKYHTEGESRECLLTMVLKADFGGVVSERSRLARLFGPLAGVGLRGLLEPVVSSVIVLRDKVEQDRFVLRPLSSSDPTAAVGAAEPLALGPAEEAARRRAAVQKRSASTLAYRREPLLLAQRAVAAEQVGEPCCDGLVVGMVVDGGDGNFRSEGWFACDPGTTAVSVVFGKWATSSGAGLSEGRPGAGAL